jgi:hypothetical protein
MRPQKDAAMPDDYDLQRFVEAQGPVYASAVAELKQGRKRSHWMWFIFPQVAGLGFSAMAQRYAIASVDEGMMCWGRASSNARALCWTSKANPSRLFSARRTI